MVRGYHRVAVVAIAAVVVTAACGGPTPSRSPHPALAHTTSAASANAACARCHDGVAAEWRRSNHAEAFRHETFQAAYRAEPLPFCAGCHAPLANAAAPRAPESDLGVACTTCHPGGVRAARDGADRACASCHEFPYPPEVENASGRLLQKTASEHKASSRSGVSCIDCHMPRVPGGPSGRRDHAFFASRSRDFVASAAEIAARREADALVVTFRRRGVGHALPTGDLFRRLVVVVESDGARRVLPLQRFTKREQELDTRPFADGQDTYTATVPTNGLAGALRWRVIYERVAHPADAEGETAVVDGAFTLAEGVSP
jgi:hypothetical protein